MSKIHPFLCAVSLSLFTLASVILFSTNFGCGSPGQVHINVLGKEGMNEDHAALICLYKLKSDTNFMRVPIESFWKGGESTFAADLVEPRTEIMLAPGDSPWKTLQVSKDTNYIGVAVDFRRPDIKGWRLAYPIAPKKPKEIKLTVVGNRVEIEK